MCAIFGLIDYKKAFSVRQREQILRVLSNECEERGTDATGYAFNTNLRLKLEEKIKCDRRQKVIMSYVFLSPV